LILLQPTHHSPFPPLTASTSGNHCSRQHSRTSATKSATTGLMHRSKQPRYLAHPTD
jgi:hypothetical protein